jgi:hypothetical protein
LRSRQRIDMPNGTLYVDTAEHTLPRKLEWYRRGGEVSERQWRDVQAIIGIQRAVRWRDCCLAQAMTGTFRIADGRDTQAGPPAPPISA